MEKKETIKKSTELFGVDRRSIGNITKVTKNDIQITRGRKPCNIMKQYNCKTRVSKQAKNEILRIIEMHDRYRKSYFWRSYGNAKKRRAEEKMFVSTYPAVAFATEKFIIVVKPHLSISCNSYYYKLGAYKCDLNGWELDKNSYPVTIRDLKNILKKRRG
jgi:hypothetical protein